jgi:hypothetical protein
MCCPRDRSCVVALGTKERTTVSKIENTLSPTTAWSTLRDDELYMVNGGVMEGGCIRLPEVLRPWINPQPTWTFVDVFSHPTIG